MKIRNVDRLDTLKYKHLKSLDLNQTSNDIHLDV